MTNDELLRNALLDAAAAEFAAELSDTSPAEASARLLRSMRAMLNDPNGWARRRRRPVWQRLARAAAMILLALSLSLGALMAASPTVRASVVRWVRETYERSVNYRFFGKTETSLPDYAPTWLPEGFVPDEREKTDEAVFSAYHDAVGGGGFTFDYCIASEDMQIQIAGYDNEIAPAPEECFVNAYTADYYPAGASGTNNLVWMDETRGILFTISSTLEKDVILHIAESVCLVDSTN